MYQAQGCSRDAKRPRRLASKSPFTALFAMALACRTVTKSGRRKLFRPSGWSRVWKAICPGSHSRRSFQQPFPRCLEKVRRSGAQWVHIRSPSASMSSKRCLPAPF